MQNQISKIIPDRDTHLGTGMWQLHHKGDSLMFFIGSDMRERDSGGRLTLSWLDRVSHEKVMLGLRRNHKKEPQGGTS